MQTKAKLIRKASGSSDIEKTMRGAVAILADSGIPSLVVGGYAVQENGYPRYTVDVDLLVSDVKEALDTLSIRGFKVNPGSNMTVTDRATHVEIDLLPAGGSVGRGPLKLPPSGVVSKEPQIADLRTLLNIKLSSYMGSPGSRLKDAADVVELIKANQLPRGYLVAKEVQSMYHKLWDNMNFDLAYCSVRSHST